MCNISIFNSAGKPVSTVEQELRRFAQLLDKRMTKLDKSYCCKKDKYHKVGTIKRQVIISTDVDVYYNPYSGDTIYVSVEGIKVNQLYY